MIRLNKYMSEAGVCSRREADRLIEAGKVTVDGMKATVGMQIEEGQKAVSYTHLTLPTIRLV